MKIIIKTLKIISLSMTLVSGIAAGSSTVYALPDAKSFGVASSDQKALMFLGMDKDANLKGICFAMVKQSTSIVPMVDINATTDHGRFIMHALRPNIDDDTKEAVCSLGSEAGDFITGISTSTFSNVKLDFNGEIRSYRFDTTEFAKLLTQSDSQRIAKKAFADYAKGVRAPVFYEKSNEIFENNNPPHTLEPDNYKVSDKKLNFIWKNLDAGTRKRLLPSQREWIKQKSICNNDQQCLIDMTNKRIIELEAENAK